MTKLYYRGMAEQNGKPKTGRSSRLLGIRPDSKLPQPAYARMGLSIALR